MIPSSTVRDEDDFAACEEDAGIFAEAVSARLEMHGRDAHADFHGAAEYAKFLDRLESLTLPAIEHAEAEVVRTRECTWCLPLD